MMLKGMAPLFALVILLTACAARAEEDTSGGWVEYTLGPPLVLSPRKALVLQTNRDNEESITVDNVHPTPDGLWAALSGKHGFARWQEGAWHQVAAPGLPTESFTTTFAETGPDGSACFKWSPRQGGRIRCSMFRGGRVRTLAEAPPGGKENQPKHLVADRNGAVWCDSHGHFAGPAWKEMAVVPAESSLYPDLWDWSVRSGCTSCAEEMRVDALGRVWYAKTHPDGIQGYPPIVIMDPAFSEFRKPAPQDNDWARSFAVVDVMGARLTPQPAAPPAMVRPGKVQAKIIPGKDNLFRVVVKGRNIWKVNPSTLEGTLLWKGADESSPWINNMFELGSTWYALATDNIYRLEGEQLVPVLPHPCEYIPDKPATTAEGAWFAGGPANLWFLPANGGPFRVVDRQSGAGLDNLYGVSMLSAGEAVGYDTAGRVVVLPKANAISNNPPLLTPPAAGTIGQIPPNPATGNPGCGWIQWQTATKEPVSGRRYGFSADRTEKRLARWDGVSWNYLDLPGKCSVSDMPDMVSTDILGNLWGFGTQTPDGRQCCAKFLPAEDRWQEWDDVEQAVPTLQPGEMVFNSSRGSRMLPVRNMDGITLRITGKGVSTFTNGEWQHWTAEDLWKTIPKPDPAAAPPPIPEYLFADMGASRCMENGIAVWLSREKMFLFREGQWAYSVSPGLISPWDFQVPPPSATSEGNNAQSLQWREQLECTFIMEEGQLCRMFLGAKVPVFNEMPVTPLPVSDTTLMASPGPGGWPLLFLGGGVLFVLLDPILPRPNATIETVKGNLVRIAANDLPPGVRLYWRENWPDSPPMQPPSGARNSVAHPNKPDEWKPVEAAGPYAVEKDKPCEVSFAPVKTDALRLEVQLPPKFSAGVYEWSVR